MINKKILWLAGAGIAAVSIAIAITINVIQSNNQKKSPDHLTCQQLQRAIDHLGRPAFDQLPKIIRNDIEWIRVRDFDCVLNGGTWNLRAGKIPQPKSESVHRPVLGDESNILDDFK